MRTKEAYAFMNPAFSSVGKENLSNAVMWLGQNPDKLDELKSLVRQLDREGLQLLGRTLLYHRREDPQDLIRYVRNTLRRRTLFKGMEDIQKHFREHATLDITMANGLKCTVRKRSPAGYFDWSIQVRCVNGQSIRINWLYLDQIFRFKNAANNINSFKQLQPKVIEYRSGKKWVPLDERTYPTVLKTVADNLPLEIALILSP